MAEKQGDVTKEEIGSAGVDHASFSRHISHGQVDGKSTISSIALRKQRRKLALLNDQ